MRNMSFALTTRQFRAREKTVTRRLGWKFLKPGERFCGVVKAMGLKPGEKIERLGICECISNRREPLDAMEDSDCAKEGFPEMNAWEFCDMFCEHMKATHKTEVSRIEFKYID